MMKRREIEGIENEGGRRIRGGREVLVFEEVCEVKKIVVVEVLWYMVCGSLLYV